MNKIVIDLLLGVSAGYLAWVVYRAIRTGKAEVKGGIVYGRRKQPAAYWTVIIVQSLIAVALIYLLFIIHR